MTNNVDPDQTSPSAASGLGLHGLLRPACPMLREIRKFHVLLSRQGIN